MADFWRRSAASSAMLAVHAALVAPRGTVAAIVATTLMDAREREVRACIMRFPGGRHLVDLMPFVAALRVPMSLVANVHAMSSVPAINAICARDRAGGGNCVPIGFLHSWMTYTPPRVGAFAGSPVLLAHPAADRWTPTALSKRALDRFAAPTRFVELPRCEHFPIEEPGLSLFRETTLDFLRPFASQPLRV
jgi:pimeloyl-ACP methyl ester carboxylesterase